MGMGGVGVTVRSDPFLLPQCSKRLLAFICSPGDEFVIYAPTEQLQEQFGSHDIGSSFSLSAFSFVCDSAYCFPSGRPRCWAVGMGMWLPLSSSCSACGLGHFPRRGRWVTPSPGITLPCFPSSHPCLVLSSSVVLTTSCLWRHWPQRAPAMCQSPRDGSGGAE